METPEEKSSPITSTTSAASRSAKMQAAPVAVISAEDVTASKQGLNVSALIEIDEEELDRDFDLRIPAPSEQRAQNIAEIFAKYGLHHTSEDTYSRSKSQIERVERKPRIRVHYICHECNATFGHDRTCKSCAHERCRDCTRYPPKKSTKDKAKRKFSMAAAKPTSSPNVTKGPCHECQTEFTVGDRECTNCHHRICKKCLAEAVENAS